MIEVKNLVKKYGDHVAVDHLTFTVEKGQIYGFLGPNGAGKSTTMNIMTGYIGATEGEVIIDGHDILAEPREAKKSIGYLPEVPPVYPDMTVMEYLKFSAELKEIKKDQRKAEIAKAIEMTQIESVSSRLIKNLSKGYRQRVGLAHAIMGFPPIIILDEPTVGLDPKQIIEIRDLIKELGKDHTVILSSHILSEISEVCDYVMIISHGKLIASDTTDNLTRMMQGQNVYNFQVRGSESRIKGALGVLQGVDKVSVKKTNEDGILNVTVECKSEIVGHADSSSDYRDEIFYALAGAKCPMLAPAQHVSLEDIFLELTEDQPQAAVKKEKKRRTAKKAKEGISAKGSVQASDEKAVQSNDIEDADAADTIADTIDEEVVQDVTDTGSAASAAEEPADTDTKEE